MLLVGLSFHRTVHQVGHVGGRAGGGELVMLVIVEELNICCLIGIIVQCINAFECITSCFSQFSTTYISDASQSLFTFIAGVSQMTARYSRMTLGTVNIDLYREVFQNGMPNRQSSSLIAGI